VARAQHTVNEIRQRKPSQSDSRAGKKTGPAKRQTCCPSRLTGFGGAVTDGPVTEGQTFW
jgi:hypothetical protein